MSTLNAGLELRHQFLDPGALCTVVVVVLTLLLMTQAFQTNFPKIEGIPEVDNNLPFVGHLRELGGRSSQNDSTVFTQWQDKASSDIVQCRIGNQRSIIVRGFKTIKELWINHSNALIDRPHQPGFVDKLGVDITGSPMTDQIRRCRMAAMRALGKPMWPKYYHLLEPSSVNFVANVFEKGQNGKSSIDIYYYLRQIVFDLGLSLTYGARFGEVDNEFMITYLKSINDISAVRSSTKSFRHYVPLLRLIPERTSKTIAAEKVRRVHTEVLYNAYKERVANGETVDCIVSSLSEDKLTLDEIHGTCISLLQAAPDTVASGVYQCVAWLCTPEGQETQKAAYSAILEAYGGDKDLAWNMAFREDKVPLINSLNKETLRFFTLAPFATPRRTVRDIKYKGILIPKGITMIMNAQDADHDTEYYGSDAWEFKPTRFIGDDNPLPHLAFGAGSRICPAVAISNRIITALLTKLILCFEMKPVEGTEAGKQVNPIHFSNVYDQLVAHPRFFDCRFVARDEAWLKSITGKN